MLSNRRVYSGLSLYTNSTYPLLNWTYEPTNFMGTFSRIAKYGSLFSSPQNQNPRPPVIPSSVINVDFYFRHEKSVQLF